MNKDSNNGTLIGVTFITVCTLIGFLLFIINKDVSVDEQLSESEKTVYNDDDVEYVDDSTAIEDNLLETYNDEQGEGEQSYQEQLRSSGQVDGRSRDYWSIDEDGNEDHEFGGAELGMLYPEFRDRLMFVGFEAQEFNRNQLCETEPENTQCSYQYPETKNCNRTIESYCTYSWSRGEDSFTVTTMNSEAGKVIEMKVQR